MLEMFLIGAPCSNELLGKDERKVILKHVQENKEKVILVHLDSKFASCVPDKFKGIDLVDGVNGMSQLVEVKITAKVK